jgi:hypothetical protein
LRDGVSGPDQDWRDRFNVAALDPFRGYATALRTSLPQAPGCSMRFTGPIVAGLAITFAQLSGQTPYAVHFSRTTAWR